MSWRSHAANSFLGLLALLAVYGTALLERAAASQQSNSTRRFEGDGTLTWYKGTELEESYKTSFNVRVDGCRWLITVKSPEGVPGVHRCGSDDNDLYSVYDYAVQDVSSGPGDDTNGLAWKQTQEDLKRGRINDPAKVLPGSLPEFDVQDSDLIWLAFASGCAFRGKPTVTVPGTVLSYLERTKDGNIEAQCGWDRTDPGMLNCFTVFHEGTLYPRDGRVIPLAPPLDKGFTNFTYQVLEYTNLSSARVPIHFEMAWFLPTSVTKPTQLARGTVEHLKSLRGHESGIPLIESRKYVDDFRAKLVADVEKIRYYTADEWWQTNETRFIKLTQGIYIEQSRPKYYFVFVVALVILAVSYPILARTARSRTTTQT